MKIAVDLQSGPRMAAFTSLVTYVWPAVTRPGGCSLTAPGGLTHDTAGSVPVRAASKYCDSETTFPTWPSACTVVNEGSGFQIPGVFAPCRTDSQIMSSSSQSGSVPEKT